MGIIQFYNPVFTRDTFHTKTPKTCETFEDLKICGKLSAESCWRAFPVGLEVFKTFELLGTM